MPDQLLLNRSLLHPLHALILAFPIALFAGALASDITYLNTAVIQWSNFSAWMIAAALLFGGIALAWGLVLLVGQRSRRWPGRLALYVALLAVMWAAGLINAFHHSRDGWSAVGTTGLLLSIVSTVLALAAGWIAYSGVGGREIGR